MPGPRPLTLIALAMGVIFGVVAVAQDVPAPTAPSGFADQPPPPPPPVAPTPPPPRTLSPVIWSEDPDIVQRFAVNNAVARQMVNRCLLRLTSATDIGTAWQRLGITSRDVVGVKITTIGGPLMSSHRAVVQAVCDGLIAAGVPTTRIIVWDKNASDMRAAGYDPQPPSESHVGISAIFPGTGYDPDAIYKNGLLGTLIWGDSEFRNGNNDDLTQAASDVVTGHSAYGSDSVGDNFGDTDNLLNSSAPLTSNKSHFARLVTTICTKIVNVPVLTDNPYVGIDGCMSSLALGSVDNNRRFQGDPTFGDPAIGEILNDPILRRKVVVNILDAMIAQYAGGPRFNPVFTRQLGGIYVSRDPVAIDAIALQRLERFRANDTRSGRLDPIGRTAVHVHGAADLNLGTDDASRIQLVRVEP